MDAKIILGGEAKIAITLSQELVDLEERSSMNPKRELFEELEEEFLVDPKEISFLDSSSLKFRSYIWKSYEASAKFL